MYSFFLYDPVSYVYKLHALDFNCSVSCVELNFTSSFNMQMSIYVVIFVPIISYLVICSMCTLDPFSLF